MLRIAENGFPRQCAHWLGMTVVFDYYHVDFGAVSYQVLCHCEEREARRGTEGNACGAIRFHKQNDKLKFELVYDYEKQQMHLCAGFF